MQGATVPRLRLLTAAAIGLAASTSWADAAPLVVNLVPDAPVRRARHVGDGRPPALESAERWLLTDRVLPANREFELVLDDGDAQAHGATRATVELWPQTPGARCDEPPAGHGDGHYLFAMARAASGKLTAHVPPLQLDQRFCLRVVRELGIGPVQYDLFVTDVVTALKPLLATGAIANDPAFERALRRAFLVAASDWSYDVDRALRLATASFWSEAPPSGPSLATQDLVRQLATNLAALHTLDPEVDDAHRQLVLARNLLLLAPAPLIKPLIADLDELQDDVRKGYFAASTAVSSAQAALVARLRAALESPAVRDCFRASDAIFVRAAPDDGQPGASVASDGNGDYVSLDAGAAFAIPTNPGRAAGSPWLVPYLGVNVYFAPGHAIDWFHTVGPAYQRLRLISSLTIALSLTSPTVSGVPSRPIGWDHYPLVGFGFRWTRWLRTGAGLMFYWFGDANPAKSTTYFGVAPYLSASLDVDVIGIVTRTWRIIRGGGS
jgi:hypothetical protein